MKKPIIYKTRPPKKVWVECTDINAANPLRQGDKVRATNGDIGTVVGIEEREHRNYQVRRYRAIVDWESGYNYRKFYDQDTGLLEKEDTPEYMRVTRIDRQ